MKLSDAITDIASQVTRKLEEPVSETITLLEALNEVLAAREYQCIHTPWSDASPLAKLHVVIGRMGDALLIARFVSLTDTALFNEESDSANGEEPEVIHGTLVLPFTFAQDCLIPTARAILLLNRFLPQCSFGISETEGTCFLQGSFAMEPGGDLPGSVAAQVVDQMAFATHSYVPLLEGVASGKHTFDDLVLHLSNQGLQADPIHPVRYPVAAIGG